MIFYIHFILLTSGLSGTSVLLGVFFQAYSDASQGEIGLLLMSFPFVSMIVKPLFCSMADRRAKHQLYLILALITMLIGYGPFVILPYCTHFYTQYPRWSWYTLVVACHIGNGGLGVAWSLGDSLAVNMAQKTNTPYGRMRLMGTVSWGFYGALIGQINEISYFPKYVPAFLILHVSVFIEILLLIFWNKEDFKMYDPASAEEVAKKSIESPTGTLRRKEMTSRDYAMFGSTSGSLAGTTRLTSDAVNALRNMVVAEELSYQLRKVEGNSDGDADLSLRKSSTLNSLKKASNSIGKNQTLSKLSGFNLNTDQEVGKEKTSSELKKSHDKNPQVFIFKMIFTQDGRLVKYLILFVMFGILLAPINFVFLSLVEVCKERNYNFSQLAGFVLISQAAMETLSFLVVPWIMLRVSKTSAMTFAWTILAARYFFYAYFYYTSNISPYWALLAEWGLGISFGIFCTNLADLSLMFANQSKLFIPELRKMGYLSNIDGNTNPEQIKEEENLIQTALRATMQAIFGGALDGLGMGLGALICGMIAESYSYITLWQVLMVISVVTALIHQLIEVTRCRWSDIYRPKEGTKAYEIMAMSSNHNVKTSQSMH